MVRREGKTLEEVLSEYASEKGVDVSTITSSVVEEKQGFLGLRKSVVVDLYCEKDIEDFLFNYLNDFFDGLELEVDIDITKNEEDGYEVMLNADNNAIIIGKGGQTLQALNIVVRSALSNQFKKRVKVFIDINNYKEERYEKVRLMARRVAKTVQRTHVSALLDPMPNDERKVIHQYLSNMANIKTESEGEGKNRRLRISYTDSKE